MAFTVHSYDALASAWLEVPLSCTCHLVILCTGGTLGWSAAWGSPATCLMYLAVALELSIFLASWHTLLGVNLSRSTLSSLIVLVTNSSSLRKNQRYPYVVSWQSLEGIWQDWSMLGLLCTIHQCFLYLVWSLSVNQNGPWLHLPEAYKTLQSAPKLCPSLGLPEAGSRTHTSPSQSPHSKLQLSCIFGILGVLQAHILICFCIWATTSETYGINDHWYASPCDAPLYKT